MPAQTRTSKKQNLSARRASLTLCEHKRAAIVRTLATVQSSESGWTAPGSLRAAEHHSSLCMHDAAADMDRP